MDSFLAVPSASGIPTSLSISAQLFCLASARPTTPVIGQRLGQLSADGEHRIERRHGILEDHGDFLTPNLADIRSWKDVSKITPFEPEPLPPAILPGGDGINLKMERTLTDFPEPLSPTIANDSPCSQGK